MTIINKVDDFVIDSQADELPKSGAVLLNDEQVRKFLEHFGLDELIDASEITITAELSDNDDD